MSIVLDGTLGITSVTGSASLAVAGPAFDYTADGTQSVSSGSYSKVLYATKNFDTASAVSSSRFTPLVAGYYQISCAVGISTINETVLAIFKNGSTFRYFLDITPTAIYNFSGSLLIYLNGSTDYIEVYVYQGSGTSKTLNNQSYFQGVLVRSA